MDKVAEVPQLPPVVLVDAIRVQKAGEAVLCYPHLDSSVQQQLPHEGARWGQFEERAEGGLGERKAAVDLALVYMMRNAVALNNAATPESRELWAKRFTEAGIELFGAPEPMEVARITRQQLSQFDGIDQDTVDAGDLAHVRSIYEQANRATQSIELDKQAELSEAVLESCREFVEREYGEVLALVDAEQKDMFTPKDIKIVFEKARDLLAQKNPAWLGWEMVEKENQTMVSVASAKHKVNIGLKRENATPTAVKGLLLHEILTHALRQVNGEQHGDQTLAEGLAGSKGFEEGLGLFNDCVLTGKVPEKASDYYFDIACALGRDGMPRLNRQELFSFALARAKVRAAANGQPVNEQKLESKVWKHVDRIFRGGPGTETDTPAVFTKDIAYYTGFRDVVKVINTYLQQGISIDRIMRYLVQAKFDATRSEHDEYLQSKGIEL